MEKLYTTSTALFRFGPGARLSTSVFGVGALRSGGAWHGTLFLKGGGDPTFGSAAFDHRLTARARRWGSWSPPDPAPGDPLGGGSIVGDESYFDSLRGTPATGDQISGYVEGELSALAYNRGFANPEGLVVLTTAPPCTRPAVRCTRSRSDKVTVARHVRVFTGKTPPRRQAAGHRALAHDLDADPADQRALGQLLRRDAAQGDRRRIRWRRHYGGRRRAWCASRWPRASGSIPSSTTAPASRATMHQPRRLGHARCVRCATAARLSIRWPSRVRRARWPARCTAPRPGPLPRQDGHAARRRQPGRLLHGARTATRSRSRS